MQIVFHQWEAINKYNKSVKFLVYQKVRIYGRKGAEYGYGETELRVKSGQDEFYGEGDI